MISRVRFTYEDLQHFPDDNKRRELIGGEVYVTPAPNICHQRIVANLLVLINDFSREHPLGEVLVAPVDIIFSEQDDDIAEPDLIYISKEKSSLVSKRGVEGAPDWLTEVTSPSTRNRDFTLKLKLYQKYGVRLYWILDLDAEMIHVWDEGKHRVYNKDDAIKVPLLPGLEHPVSELLML